MTLPAADQLAIQQLYARYNHAIDFGDGPGWAACFTAEGTFSSGMGTFVGTEQLQSFGSGFSQRIKARHWTNNLVLEGDGDSATGRCYLLLVRPGSAEGAPGLIATGIYADELTRGPQGWLFTKRTVTTDA
jgi:hypothetical protein